MLRNKIGFTSYSLKPNGDVPQRNDIGLRTSNRVKKKKKKAHFFHISIIRV